MIVSAGTSRIEVSYLNEAFAEMIIPKDKFKKKRNPRHFERHFEVYLDDIFIRKIKIPVEGKHWRKCEEKCWEKLRELYPNTYQRLNIVCTNKTIIP